MTKTGKTDSLWREGDAGKHELLRLLITAVTLLISHSQKHEKIIKMQDCHYPEGKRREITPLPPTLSPHPLPLQTSEGVRVHPRVEIMCEMMFHY